MSLPDRKEAEVRRLLAGPHPPVPPDLAARAAARGRRTLAFRRGAHTVFAALAGAALIAFLVWLLVTQPWVPPPAETTPPMEAW
ncbi:MULTISPECIES: hypothetical protein [Streptomyces]|uniref:Uncharacterized protein n=1 Tax=Streptomyces lycii TaxID=2654337 RepID=A0ABQ7FLC7_9ACTN|nr:MULTISPECIES: hypothetical protein [Streptomyces]KAF4409169.1 hypothetical protein GCU69_10355 [Streptomyces lycii]PGH48510.1 hypothetical protein CRI70_22755 [Streptomyces sp. Ru87]